MTILIEQKIKGYSVVDTGDTKTKAVDLDANTQTDPDRRLTFKPAMNVAKGSARWPKRPEMPDGNDGWIFKIRPTPSTGFYVTVGSYRNGTVHPFEVFANGDVPRGVAPLPWLLSRVMRSTDKKWLLRNLKTLGKVVSQPYNLTLPGGKVVEVGGNAAALAAVVNHHCEALGYFDDMGGESPMLNSLMAEKEPKTGAGGCTTFSWDVKSQSTPDDGLLTVKEAVTADGTRVPLSIWLSGSIEKDWDAMCKLLSLQMQCSDLELIATTLLELENFHERNGEYGFAEIPGSTKQKFYPSTIAYIAALLRSRYVALGLLDADGRPVTQRGLFCQSQAPTSELASEVVVKPVGATCGQCGESSLVRLDGCWCCTSCGFSKCS